MAKNRQKWPKMAKKGSKMAKKGGHFEVQNPKIAKIDPQARVAPFFRSKF